ncbi:MAG: type II secretion system protein J [Desulfonatronovibrio sp.]|nr:prepilin-type N-terminal cleavage/methylation domain-containing protein [Desulfovibrionales bacterium]
MAKAQITRLAGFSLVEILVALTVAGILSAMLASIVGQSLVSSQALMEQQGMDRQKITLRKILHRDLNEMLWASSLEPTPQGFELKTGHNTLIASSLPMQVSWNFTSNEIIRTEQNPDLDYLKKQTLSTRLNSFSMDIYCPVQKRWIPHDNWLMAKQRPAPGALRLELDLDNIPHLKIIEHLQGHD